MRCEHHSIFYENDGETSALRKLYLSFIKNEQIHVDKTGRWCEMVNKK